MYVITVLCTVSEMSVITIFCIVSEMFMITILYSDLFISLPVNEQGRIDLAVRPALIRP